LAGLAGTAVGQGRMQRAARLFGAAERLTETHHWQPAREYQREIDRSKLLLRDALDDAAYAAAWAEGRAQPLKQAVAYALSDDEDILSSPR